MSRKKSYLIYTGLFLIVFFLGFLVFFVQGKSFVWKSDGYRQYYPVLQYLGSYYRNVLTSLFTHPSQIPMIDYTIGQGEDILATFANYGLGDPLTFFSVFVPAAYTEYLYDVLVVLRLYLSGISFMVYCAGIGRKREYSIFGALAYVFCGFAIWSVKDPFFLNALIYLPLILLGIEWILKKKTPLLLSLGVFCCVMSGYYFFYMIVLCAFVYFCIRGYMVYGKKWSQMAGRGGWCLAAGLGGVLTSGILMAPLVCGFLKSSRTETYISFSSLFLYDLSYYKDMLTKLFMVTEENDASAVWYTSMAVLIFAALYLLVQKKDRVSVVLRNCVIACVLVVASPLAGYVLNGFGYITNRFMFIPAFLLSIVLVHMMPDLLARTDEWTKKKRYGLVVFAGLYAVACLFLSGKEGILPAAFMAVMLCATLLVLLFIKNGKWRMRLMMALVVLNLVGNINLIYQKFGADVADDYMKAGSVRAAYRDSAVSEAKKLAADEDALARIDVLLHNGENPNQSVVAKYPGVSVYYSVINGAYFDYMNSLENTPDLMYTHRILGNDGRTVLENLANVRYVVSRKRDMVPYGFEPVEGKKDVYANTNPTSIGYLCDSYVSEEDYDKADVFERQNVLLSSVVLKSTRGLYQKAEDSKHMKQGVFQSGARKISYEETEVKNIVRSKGKWEIEEKNGYYNLAFSMKPGYEYYLRLAGLELIEAEVDNRWGHITMGELFKRFIISNEKYDFYFGRKDYLICLESLPAGQTGEEQRELEFRINGRAKYRLEDMEIIEVPLENLSEKAGQLYSERLYDVKVTENGTISGRTPELAEGKILCLSVPYKNGYTLYVDGKETDYEKVNKMYVGAWIPKGEHEILLTYVTPGLKSGGALSVCGIVLIVFLSIFHKNVVKISK